MTSRPSHVSALTLFVEDLAETRRFYEAVFGVPIVHEDTESVVFGFPHLLVNLLQVDAAPELVSPGAVGGADTPIRSVLTVDVDDVDATCAYLAEQGVALLNGPMDRPWGPRTASFRDPGGHVWEIAS